MAHKKSKGVSDAVKLGAVGAAVAGLAAAYFFMGPNAKKHQKHAKAWAIKMKGDVVDKLEKASKMSKPIYDDIVDSVAKEYKKRKKAGQTEINALTQDLKKHWKNISTQ